MYHGTVLMYCWAISEPLMYHGTVLMYCDLVLVWNGCKYNLSQLTSSGASLLACPSDGPSLESRSVPAGAVRFSLLSITGIAKGRIIVIVKGITDLARICDHFKQNTTTEREREKEERR